jgi:hypothetical protein
MPRLQGRVGVVTGGSRLLFSADQGWLYRATAREPTAWIPLALHGAPENLLQSTARLGSNRRYDGKWRGVRYSKAYIQ